VGVGLAPIPKPPTPKSQIPNPHLKEKKYLKK